jgi:PAS domain S-box-containing protein
VISWSEQNFRNWRMNPDDTALSIDQILARETPASRARHKPLLDRILAHGTPYEIDIEIVHADGTTAWMATHGEVAASVNGKPTHLHGTVQDITERKRVEIALQESEQRTRLGAEVASLALAEVDYVAGTIQLTAEAARMFGFGDSATSVSRDVLHAIFHPHDHEAVERRIAESFNPNSSGMFDMDHRIVWPNGEVRWLRVREQIYFEGEGESRRPHHGILAAFDITNSKNIETALLRSEKLASVGRMAATIAHEINNPLETIGQAVYLAITDPGITDEGKHYLELANQELDRAALITRQTLAFSREASSASHLDLQDKVDNVLNLFAPRFKARGIQIRTRFRPASQIFAFAGELRQLLSNLLSNSMDATPTGGRIYLRVAGYTAPNATQRVRLVIADTGSGIAPEHIDSIFDAFFTTKEIVGTGLGLWVSRQILEKHGAAIRVRSQPGKGTVFSISFPAAT